MKCFELGSLPNENIPLFPKNMSCGDANASFTRMLWHI